MPRLNVRKKVQGFTLIETLIIIVIIGILSAIAVPSLSASFDRFFLNQAVAEVRGALQEAQRQAIRTSKPCQIMLEIKHEPYTNNDKFVVTAPCLSSGDRIITRKKLEIATNINNTIVSNILFKITFGILGTAEFSVASSVIPPDFPTDSSGKIIFYLANKSVTEKKCIAISNTLGLTRVGKYSGSTISDNITDSGTCTAS